jgi:hypothetical protein
MRSRLNVPPAVSSYILQMAAVAALLMTHVPGCAQSIDFDPAALGKQRAALCLKAAHSSLPELESDVNHLAVLSETCRAQYGTKACGLPDKPLTSDKLEERYAYYVRRPLEEHLNGRGMKIDRRNWGTDAAAVDPQSAGVDSRNPQSRL